MLACALKLHDFFRRKPEVASPEIVL